MIAQSNVRINEICTSSSAPVPANQEGSRSGSDQVSLDTVIEACLGPQNAALQAALADLQTPSVRAAVTRSFGQGSQAEVVALLADLAGRQGLSHQEYRDLHQLSFNLVQSQDSGLSPQARQAALALLKGAMHLDEGLGILPHFLSQASGDVPALFEASGRALDGLRDSESGAPAAAALLSALEPELGRPRAAVLKACFCEHIQWKLPAAGLAILAENPRLSPLELALELARRSEGDSLSRDIHMNLYHWAAKAHTGHRLVREMQPRIPAADHAEQVRLIRELLVGLATGQEFTREELDRMATEVQGYLSPTATAGIRSGDGFLTVGGAVLRSRRRS